MGYCRDCDYFESVDRPDIFPEEYNGFCFAGCIELTNSNATCSKYQPEE